MDNKIYPNIHISKFDGKFSVRIEWREEGYQLVKSFDDLVALLKKEFGENET